MPTNDFGVLSAAPSTTLWLVDGRKVADDDLAFFLEQLGADEAQRHARFMRPERQRQFLLGRMLLRLAVSRMCRLPLASISIVERQGNAPELLLADPHCAPPAFSLSHSGDWIACVVSADSVVGLDIETIDAGRDIIGIAQSAFHASESAWLRRQANSARIPAFYHLWSLKEALYKLRSNAGNAGDVPNLVGQDGALASQGEGWSSYALPHPAVSIVICSANSLPEIDVKQDDCSLGVLYRARLKEIG